MKTVSAHLIFFQARYVFFGEIMTFSQNLHEHLLLYVILLVEDSTVLK